ncbi:MAG: hypothetical protein PHR00_04470 [Patescibacteria group bacterium]|nr:hypothetical protein [Patescibacteria group bacterium]
MIDNRQVKEGQVIGEHPQAKELTKQQKIGVVVLAILTIFIVIFWWTNLQKDLIYLPYSGYDPAKLQADEANKAKNAAAYEESQAKIDTDGDGLSDQDEASVYNTSAYLVDTDGDGISDGQEVKNNTDPNCPEGKNCLSGGLYGVSATPSSSITEKNSAANVLYDKNAQAEAIKSAFGETPDPDELRKTLLASASNEDKEMINKLTDSQLIELYQRVLTELPVSSGATTGVASTTIK